MKSNSLSIRMIITISYIVLILMTFITIAYFVFANWMKSAENMISRIENDANEAILTQIDQLIDYPLNLNEVNHLFFEKQMIDLDNTVQRENFFAGVIQSTTEDVYSFSIGTEQGRYYGARRNENNEFEIMRNDKTTNGHSHYFAITENLTAGALREVTDIFDPRIRDWYIKAKEMQKPVFSSVHKHFVMEDLAISASRPIYDENGTLLGVLGTHFILSKINNYLVHIVKDTNTIAYIVENHSGELIANSLNKPNFITLSDSSYERLKISDIEQPFIKEAYQNYIQTAENNFVVNTEDDNLRLHVTNYTNEGIDWLIITAVSENEFTGEITKNIQLSIIISIIALIVSIAIYLKSTEIVLRPIDNLISTAEKFSKGNFSQRARVFRNDEVGKLSHAFNRMADELNTLIHSLEEKVKERTAELEKANHVKNEFFAHVSHDMKTPLTIITAFGQELEDRKTGTLSPAQSEAVENILFGANQLATMVDNLLDVTKLSAKEKFTLILSQVKLSALAEEVAISMRSIARSKDIELIADIEDTQLIVADQTMIKRVMQNLLNNAIKFSNQGGNIYFHVTRTEHPCEGVVITVRDNGIGIPKQMQEFVFDSFYQIDHPQHTYSGTGLGLAVVKKIVEAHCGSVKIISEQGEGAAFTVFLPTYPEIDDEVKE